MEHSEFKNQIMELSQSIKTCMKSLVEPAVQAEGLTSLQAMILLAIQKNIVNNVSSLNKKMKIEQANASTICKKMEQAGFIRRVREKSDERVVTLHLTEKGTETLKRLHESSRCYDPILQTVPPEKFDLIIQGIQAMEDVLQLLLEKKNTNLEDTHTC